MVGQTPSTLESIGLPQSQSVTPLRLWILAARPPTLWAAVTPVLVGSALAFNDGAFKWGALIAALFGALCIQVAANFANDASDARKGADTSDRIGPPRVVASGLIPAASVWRATWFMFGLATIAGVYLIWIAGWWVAVIGLASIAATLGYVGGPIPYGYRGLGELFVFAFFGVVATVGSRFVHDSTAPADAWILAIPIGMLIAAILVANNIRDIETDRAAGKKTLAVIMGREGTARFFKHLIWDAFAITFVAALFNVVPLGAGLCGFAMPLGVKPIKAVAEHTEGPALIDALKRTARLQLVVGILMAAGIAAL